MTLTACATPACSTRIICICGSDRPACTACSPASSNGLRSRRATRHNRRKRMRRRHVEAVVLRAAESQVRAALGQVNEGDRLAFRVEHLHAVEIFRPAPELVGLAAAANFRRLRLQQAVAAPAAPQIAVAIDAETVWRTLVERIDQPGLVA